MTDRFFFLFRRIIVGRSSILSYVQPTHISVNPFGGKCQSGTVFPPLFLFYRERLFCLVSRPTYNRRFEFSTARLEEIESA